MCSEGYCSWVCVCVGAYIIRVCRCMHVCVCVCSLINISPLEHLISRIQRETKVKYLCGFLWNCSIYCRDTPQCVLYGYPCSRPFCFCGNCTCTLWVPRVCTLVLSLNMCFVINDTASLVVSPSLSFPPPSVSLSPPHTPIQWASSHSEEQSQSRPNSTTAIICFQLTTIQLPSPRFLLHPHLTRPPSSHHLAVPATTVVPCAAGPLLCSNVYDMLWGETDWDQKDRIDSISLL